VTAANLTSSGNNSGDDMLLAASCATKNVTKSLADLAVYDASVCTTGERGGSWAGCISPRLPCNAAALPHMLATRPCA
jgi:hypothetical protein